jgi:hypothetical protein
MINLKLYNIISFSIHHTRLFGFHERITSKILVVANGLVDLEFSCATLYPRFNSNGSAALLVNDMFAALSAALTNPVTTVGQLEEAIEFFKLDIGLPWVLRCLEKLKVEESTLVLAQSLKRVHVADPSSAIVSSDSPVLKAARVRKPKAGARAVVPAVALGAVSRTVTFVPPPAVKSRFGGICRNNCSLEGCAHAASCRFEHVKGSRVLTAAEKTHVKALIAMNNAKPGMPKLTEDSTVVD